MRYVEPFVEKKPLILVVIELLTILENMAVDPTCGRKKPYLFHIGLLMKKENVQNPNRISSIWERSHIWNTIYLDASIKFMVTRLNATLKEKGTH